MKGRADPTPPDPVRRGLLRGELLTRDGRARVERRLDRLGPWPPGLEAVGDACPECAGPCEAACPQEIIHFHPLDHRLPGRPYLDFSAAGCTFCGECIDACPDRQLVAGGIPHRISGRARLDQGACLAWNGVLCMSCVGRCEVRALTLDSRRRLVVDGAACTGCGACVAPCPVHALVVQWQPRGESGAVEAATP